MRRPSLFEIFALLCIPIAATAACVPASSIGLPDTPAAAATTTTLDERAAIGVELAYAAERTALELAVDSGVLKGDKAAKAASLDRRAWAAVQAVRAAYRAGNASSYSTALEEAEAAINAALEMVRS